MIEFENLWTRGKITIMGKKKNSHVCWFEDLGSIDVALVRGKNASLGEMIGALKREGI